VKRTCLSFSSPLSQIHPLPIDCRSYHPPLFFVVYTQHPPRFFLDLFFPPSSLPESRRLRKGTLISLPFFFLPSVCGPPISIYLFLGNGVLLHSLAGRVTPYPFLFPRLTLFLPISVKLCIPYVRAFVWPSFLPDHPASVSRPPPPTKSFCRVLLQI